MDGASKRVTTAIAVLLVLVVALASSAAYFAYRASVVTPAAGSGSSPSLNGRAFAVLAGGQQAAVSSPPNSISVSGTGAATYIPNEALIRLSTVTVDKSAVDATSSNAATTLKVIKALNGAGVSNNSIQSQGYDLSVDYSNCYNGQPCIPQIIGYRVTNNLLVNITSGDPKQLGLQAGIAIDTAVGAGANQISLSFSETNSGLATLTNTALQQAIAAASSKAKTMASSLGVTITGVISASEGSASVYSPQYYGVPAVQGIAAGSTPILPGSQSFTVTVQVLYGIS